MSFRKSLSVIALVSIAMLTACSDVTGPTQPNGFCPITGGPGTCAGSSMTVKP